MTDRLERLTNLVATLLDTRRPLTLEEIVELVPGYPDDKLSYRRQFERDKDTLRGIGIPVRLESVDGLGPEQGYRVPPDEYYLPSLDLTADEQAALHVAVTAVRLEGGPAPAEALWKLGGREGEAAHALAALPTVPALPALFDAYRSRSTVTFTYRGEGRHVDPWGILFRRGHWYVVGHDHDRGEQRSFRVDRVEGDVDVGPAGAFEPPARLEPGAVIRHEPWQYGEEDVVAARVLVDASQAAAVVDQVGEAAVKERRDEGSVVVELPVTNTAAFLSFVLGLLDSAEVIAPPELRAEMVDWLERIAAGNGVSPRPLASSRLRRVLALVPWIAEHPGAALAEIAARFGVSEAELEHDLELLPLCGLPPYTPDRLIEVEIIDGHVWIRFAEYFDRPLRFSAEEGLALLTAGRALLAVPGSDERGALATALDKLAGALGATEGLSVEVGEPPHLDALRRAADTHERVEIDYYSFGRNATTSRKIDPRSVFHAFGHWYAAAYCHQAQDERLFRLDRIRAVRPTGEHFDPAAGEEPDFGESVYHPRSDDPRVTLELDAAATWVVESYPSEEAEERPNGSWRVVLAVSERAWLERLLLELGPAARVVAPSELQTVGAEAADRLLTRYRD